MKSAWHVLVAGTMVIMFLFWPASLSASAVQLHVFVSIPPQKYFVQQIGKDRTHIDVMVPPGASPATYEPKPRQMTALARATIFFSIGVPFEQVWMARIAAANPMLTVVPTDQGIQKRPMDSHHGEDARSGPGDDEHPAGMLDPHIWTSPPLVMKQVHTMLVALQKADPENSRYYAANYHHFMDELIMLDAELKALFADKKGTAFLTLHPSWGYFAHTYGLQQVSIEIEGKAPKPAQLKAMIAQARERHIQVIFVQPQFSAKSADLIAKAIGGRVIPADPLAADWASNLRNHAQQLNAALR